MLLSERTIKISTGTVKRNMRTSNTTTLFFSETEMVKLAEGAKIQLHTETDTERPGWVSICPFLADPVDESEDDSGSLDEEEEYEEIDEDEADDSELDDEREPFERLSFKDAGVVSVLVDGEHSRSIPIDPILWSLFDNLDATGDKGLTVADLIRSVRGWSIDDTEDSAVLSAISRLRKFIKESKLPYEIICQKRQEKKYFGEKFYALRRAGPNVSTG